MKQKKPRFVQLLLKAFYKLTAVKRIGFAVIKTAKKPRRLLRAMLFWLKELKFKGKCRALYNRIKCGKSHALFLFHSKYRTRYHSSAAYIMMEEAYFPLM